MAAMGPGCVKTRTLFFKVEFWPRLGGNSSQEIFRHHREGTTKEKDSQQVSRRSVFTQPGPIAGRGRALGAITPILDAPMRKPSTPPRTLTAADAHALADRLERNQRPQSDQAMAAKLIRALLAGRAAGDIIVLHDD